MRRFCFAFIQFYNLCRKICPLCKMLSLNSISPVHHSDVFTQCHNLASEGHNPKTLQPSALFQNQVRSHLSQGKVIPLLHCTITPLPVTAENCPVYL